MAIAPFKVIQGHRFWYQSKAMRLPIIVINTNLPLILHRFQVMADHMSNFPQRQGSLHLNALAEGDPLQISP